jgi:hypothetical protein
MRALALSALSPQARARVPSALSTRLWPLTSISIVRVTLTHSQTHRLTDSQTHTLTDSQTHRLTHSQTHRLTHSPKVSRLTNLHGHPVESRARCMPQARSMPRNACSPGPWLIPQTTSPAMGRGTMEQTRHVVSACGEWALNGAMMDCPTYHLPSPLSAELSHDTT